MNKNVNNVLYNFLCNKGENLAMTAQSEKATYKTH